MIAIMRVNSARLLGNRKYPAMAATRMIGHANEVALPSHGAGNAAGYRSRRIGHGTHFALPISPRGNTQTIAITAR